LKSCLKDNSAEPESSAVSIRNFLFISIVI
jgi:hypothetical protein